MVEQPRFFSWFRDFRPKQLGAFFEPVRCRRLPRHPAISQLFLFLLLAILAINTGVVPCFGKRPRVISRGVPLPVHLIDDAFHAQARWTS